MLSCNTHLFRHRYSSMSHQILAPVRRLDALPITRKGPLKQPETSCRANSTEWGNKIKTAQFFRINFRTADRERLRTNERVNESHLIDKKAMTTIAGRGTKSVSFVIIIIIVVVTVGQNQLTYWKATLRDETIRTVGGRTVGLF